MCFYVLLGLSFAFECVGEFGSGPFFTSQGTGSRSDYVYFSFITMATATSRLKRVSGEPWR